MMLETLVAAALALQDPAEEAVTLARELRKQQAGAGDSEVRLRLVEIARRMGDLASVALSGEHEDPAKHVLRFHDVRTLLVRPRDHYSQDFWSWTRGGGGPLTGATFILDEPTPAALGEESLGDLIKERTEPGAWEKETTIERTPNGQFLVNAPPGLQRKVARVLQDLEKEALADFRISVTLFASARPLALPAGADGSLSAETWEKLSRQADEGGAVRRLASLDTAAQAEQTVSAFSGVRRPVAMQAGESGVAAQTVPEGLALQARATPSGESALLKMHLAWTKVLAVDEVATSKGTLRLPRIAEAGFDDLRTVPAGRAVVLGTMGPLPAEAETPPHVTVIVRVSRVRP